MRIAQAMLLLGVGEDPFNVFLAHGINIAAVRLTKLFSQIGELLPNMCGQRALTVLFDPVGCRHGQLRQMFGLLRYVRFSITIGKKGRASSPMRTWKHWSSSRSGKTMPAEKR